MLSVVPVYSRTIPVFDVGIFQIATAVALIAQPIATMRLEMITPATRSLGLVRSRTRLAYLVSSGLAVAAMMTGFGLWLTHSVGADLLVGAGLLLLGYAWIAIDNAVMLRLGELGPLAWRNALAGLLAAILQLTAALWLPSAVALAGAVVLGRAVAILLTYRPRPPAWYEDRPAIDDDSFGVERAFPAILAGVVTASALQGLMLTVSVIFGPLGSAQLGMAQRIAGTPTSLVGQGLSQIVAARGSAIIRARSGVLESFVRSTSLRLCALAAIVCATLIVLGPLLAVPVLGPEWETAGTLIAVLAAPLSMYLVLVPTMPIMIMIKRERLLLILNSFRLFAIVLATTVAGLLTRELLLTAAITATVWVIAYLLSLASLGLAARRWDREVDPR